MATHNDEFFSTWKDIWSRPGLPLTPESDITRSNSNCTETSEENHMKSLLSLDETIFNNIELDHVKLNQEYQENKDVHESWFNEDLDKSRFIVDSYDQKNCDYNLSWKAVDDEFGKYNSNINDELNRSVDLLKKKLLSCDNDGVIPHKKRHIDLFKNDITSDSFYGLPDKVRNLIKKHKGIDKLYDWQEECLNMSAINKRKNLIYALPTSGGKTLVAEILMLKEIVCRKKNAMFILPFVALVQEKIQSMTPFALELNFLIEEYAAEKGHYPPRKRRKKNSLYICTIEKAQAIINCLIELDRLDEIGIIVVDELHLLGEDGGRGATLECLLTKVLFSKRNIQIIGMSATIGNLKEIALFLDAELYVRNFRPIDIKEYVKCENEIWLINSKEENMFTDKKIVNYKYTKEALERDPDFLAGLVMDVVPKDSCLVFCSTKKNCENVAKLLADILGNEVQLKSHKEEEKLILLNALKTESGQICSILKKTIKFGFAYHHSGLTAEERRLLEEAFKSGVLCVICCTSTLAAGVNLPARRVILRSPYVGTQFLNISRYKQMIGRAGRAGLGEIGESILICSKVDTEKVRELLSSKMDDSVSSLHEEKDRGINNLIISAVLLSIASTRADIHKIVSKSLLKVQEERLGISIKEVTDTALATLVKSGILREKKKDFTTPFSKLDASVIFPTQIQQNESKEEINGNEQKKNVVRLTNSTELELCPLGKAAMKGSIDLQTAAKLYQDLKKAQKNLILEDHLHLLYLITPYEIASQVKPVGTVYYDVILSLPPHQMQVARLLGINEAVVAKLRGGLPTSSVSASVVQKFYVTLMLLELWHRKSIHLVAEKYQVNRGTIQNLLSSASSFSSSVVRFCQELDEFWAFKNLLSEFGQKLTYCCAAELEPLMELPFVRVGRAMQLYKAGYKTLQSIAKAKPEDMVDKIKHLPRRVVSQIISAAKLLVLEKVENLRDEVEEVLDGLEI